MLFVIGVLAALHERAGSGEGQVIDAAMVDGSATLMTMPRDFQAMGVWTDERGTNLLDTGSPYYDVYETSDGGWMAVGPLETQFYARLLEGLGLDPATLPDQHDKSGWPRLREVFTETFLTRTREEWSRVFEGTDACVSPVLTMDEATQHPHNVARSAFVEVGGMLQAAPSPRFGRTPPATPVPLTRDRADVLAALADFGVGADEAQGWVSDGVLG